MKIDNYYKISAYCTLAERCISEAREKMRKYEFEENEIDELIERLVAEGFINEERYAVAFTKDKFKFAKWGKRKIEYALRMKGISGANIAKAIDTIDDAEYEALKKSLAESKKKTLKGDPNDMSNRAKVLRFLASRGFMIAALVMLASPCAMAQGHITGVAREYAGRTLELLYEDNGITGVTVSVDSCKVDDTGAFKFSTGNLTDTRKCFIPLGFYKGSVYVEPYKEYSVNLPPLTLPSEADELNPYFTPKEVLLSLNHPASDDLNLRITQFDDSFDVAMNRIIKGTITPEAIEREYTELEYNLGDRDPFFTAYRYSSYAILVNLYEKTQPTTAIEAFFLNAPVAYNNPAYWDAFNILFEQYKDVEKLSANPALKELVIMHHILAGTADPKLLDEIKVEQNLPIAQQIREIIGRTAVGSKTSTQRVVTIEGEKLTLKDFETPQFYIIFANSKLTKSVSDIDYALSRNSKWKGRCTVLVIFKDGDRESIEKLTKKIKDRSFILLGSKNEEFIKAFNVTHAPAYFRIDWNGKILEAPAASPASFSL